MKVLIYQQTMQKTILLLLTQHQNDLKVNPQMDKILQERKGKKIICLI